MVQCINMGKQNEQKKNSSKKKIQNKIQDVYLYTPCIRIRCYARARVDVSRLNTSEYKCPAMYQYDYCKSIQR